MAFDQEVAPGGYAWWYVDALSDDGRYCLTVIFFVGSVFSPGYAAAIANGEARAEDYCAVNVSLRGPGLHEWVMTESNVAHRGRDALLIEQNLMQLRDGKVHIVLDDRTCPFPRPFRKALRGRITLVPETPAFAPLALEQGGIHLWYPMAPHAHVEVELDSPRLSFRGRGYHDGNSGDEPLARTLRRWQWSRLEGRDDTAIFYDVERRDGSRETLALRFDQTRVERVDASTYPLQDLPRTAWSLSRQARGDAASTYLERTLEDTPFYARSLVRTTLGARPYRGVHESLELDRFEKAWVRRLLPFRMRRR